MESEFTINVELLKFGGNIELTIIPQRRVYQVILDGMELCTLQLNKNGLWVDLEEQLDTYSAESIGLSIQYYLDEVSLRKAS